LPAACAAQIFNLFLPRVNVRRTSAWYKESEPPDLSPSDSQARAPDLASPDLARVDDVYGRTVACVGVAWFGLYSAIQWQGCAGGAQVYANRIIMPPQ
jgi:hypothetical protein